jgi:hypothetical protein
MRAVKVAEQIEQLGFRRWYERQLVESHAYLLTAFLALVLLLAGFEALSDLRGSPLYYLLLVATAAGAGVLMWVASRRFLAQLGRAELFAERAACPQCHAWGRFRVLGAEPELPDDPPEAGRPHWVRVCCRKCGHTWRLG